MGFKDLFATGTSKRDRNYYPRGIPTASDYHYNGQINQDAEASGRRMSATDKLYMNYGSQSAAASRSMSLTSRSMRDNQNHAGQRTMSMTSGRPFGRAPSVSRSGRPNGTPGSKPPSRTNSINSRTSVNNNYQRKPSSRTNSLTSNSSRNPRYIKTTTTTKEQDTSGRTRSITRTTVEQRGNVKIVRTTKTVITPGTGFVEGDPNLLYEGFDEDMHRPDNNLGNEDYGYEMEPVAEIENDILFEEDEEHYEDSYNTPQQSPQQQARATAVGAAAAALGNNIQQRQSARAQYQWDSPSEHSKRISNDFLKKQNEVRFSEVGQSSPGKNLIPQAHKPVHAHFTDPSSEDQHVYQSYETAGSGTLSHNFHSADTKYPAESSSSTNILANQKADEQTEDDNIVEESEQGDIYEAPLEDNVDENFDMLRKKRLSEIAEVTENYDDTVDLPSKNNSICSHTDLDPKDLQNDNLEMEDTVDINKNLSYVEVTPGAETEDEYVEASETLVPDNSQEYLVSTNIATSSDTKQVNPEMDQNNETFDNESRFSKKESNTIPTSGAETVKLGVALKDPSTAPNTSHLYRNLLGNDQSQTLSATNSPSKNSIPRFAKESQGPPQKYLAGNECMKRNSSGEKFVETSGLPADFAKLKNKPLKSAMKQSATSSIRSANGSVSDSAQNVPIRSSMIVQDEFSANNSPKLKQSIGPNSESSPPLSQYHKKELSPDLMYAMAFKAAEKKVYGEERSAPMMSSQGDDFDTETMRNTHINSQSSSIDMHPEMNFSSVSSNGKSNLNSSKFKTHSLRDGTAPVKKDLPTQNALAQEEVKRKKRELKADANKEKKKWEEERNDMLARMHLNQKGQSNNVAEGNSTDPSFSPTKKKLLNFNRKKSIDDTHMGDLSTSSKDSKSLSSGINKKTAGSIFGIGRKKSISEVKERDLQDVSEVDVSATFVSDTTVAALPLSVSEQPPNEYIEASAINHLKAQKPNKTKEKDSKSPPKKDKKKGKSVGSMFKKLFDLN